MFFKYNVTKTNENVIVTRKMPVKNEIDVYELNIIAGKYCDGLAPCNYEQVGKIQKLHYMMPAASSLKTVLKRENNVTNILSLLFQSAEIFFNCQYHHLDLEKLELDTANVYVTDKEQKLQFIYNPEKETIRKASIKNFYYEVLMERIRYGDTRILQLRKYLHESNVFSILEFGNLVGVFLNRRIEIKNKNRFGESTASDWQGYEKGTTVLSQQMGSEEQPYEEGTTVLSQQMGSEEQPHEEGTTVLSQQMGSEEQPYEEGTTVLSQQMGSPQTNSGNEGTTVLNPQFSWESQKAFYMVRCRTGERIELNKSIFTVGKQVEGVDYVIYDNPAISNIHARFIRRQNRLFLMDNDSTNKTYLNDCQLEPYKEEEVKDGSIIMLADEVMLME